MTEQNKALVSSAAIHLILVLLAIGVMRATPPEKKTLRIDFSLVDRPEAMQPKQPASRTESAELKRPVPPRSAKKHISLEKNVVMRPVHHVQPVVLTENQVTAATPQPPPGSDTSAGERGIADGTEPVSATSSPAATTESMEIKYVKAHFGAIRNAITSKLSYPPTARRMGWSGTVKVSFVVNEDGGVSNVKVIETSGHELLDNSAVDTITRGSPYPKPPCRAEIVMPIKFRLDE